MAMSDCGSCWETPCVCGKGYKHLSLLELEELVRQLNSIIRVKILMGHIRTKRYHKGDDQSLVIKNGIFTKEEK